MPIADASHRFEHRALTALEPRQRILDSVAARVLGGDVRVMGGLVAEALDEDEHASVGRVPIDVERDDARLCAGRGHEPLERRLDRFDLAPAGDPTRDDEHARHCTVRAMRTVLITLALAAIAVPAAAAPEVRRCGNVDRSDRFGAPSAHGAFGIFGVRAQGVGCRPARRLARRWLGWAEKASSPSKSHAVGGYLCRSHALAAQQLAVRCSSKTALVRFTWRIANG
jgi:hypothetical protein